MSKEIDEYPSIKNEIEEKKKMVSLQYVDDEIATEIEEELKNDAENVKEIISSSRLAGFDPSAIDFIRRCDTTEQAKEIIDYLEQKSEINHLEAKKLRELLSSKGLRSFGSKKEKGYYFNQQD